MKFVTSTEIVNRGVSYSHLRKLVADGLPVARTKKSSHGKPENVFNAADAAEWLGKSMQFMSRRDRRRWMLYATFKGIADAGANSIGK